MKKLTFLFIFSFLCISTAVSAASRGSFVVGSVQPLVQEGKFFEIQVQLKEACGWNAYLAKRASLTIYQRDELLSEILSCFRESQAGLSASLLSSNSLNQKLALDEVVEAASEEAKNDDDETKSQIEFMGLSWGLGFGYSFSSDDAIDEAVLVDGVVRVKSNKKEQPRAILEFHKFIACNDGGKNGTRGCGPFVGVAATPDDLLSGVGFGWMFGFKAKPTDPDGFSVGIGAILDADVKDLADGFEKNQAPPAGETSVRYETESRWSALIFVTRTF
ncbi:MAG: hypothetical protein CMM07_08325 [Rhodopirellula sp.]|nr:hypothetical protein [Rhodopirellula sp.]